MLKGYKTENTMKTYIFKLTIEEVENTQKDNLLANYILDEVEQRERAKKRAEEINLKIKQKRIDILKPILKQVKEQITVPLGITSCGISKSSIWLYKDLIYINKCFASHRNKIEIFVETPYKKDGLGNNICSFEPKIKFSIKDEYKGTYTYDFTTIEEFFRVCKDTLTDYHLFNKK